MTAFLLCFLIPTSWAYPTGDGLVFSESECSREDQLSISQAEAEIRGLQMAIYRQSELKEKYETLSCAVESIETLWRVHQDQPRLWSALSQAKSDLIDIASVKEKKGQIVVTGTAKRNQDISQFIKALEANTYFSFVYLNMIEQVMVDGQKRRRFSLSTEVAKPLKSTSGKDAVSPPAPPESNADTTCAPLAAALNKRDALRGQSQQNAGLKKKMAALSKRFPSVLQYLPQGKEVPELIAVLTRKATQSGLQVSAFEPKREVYEKEHEYVATQPFTLRFTGQYHQAVEFIDALSQIKRVFLLRDIYLRQVEGEPSRFLLTANAATFRLLSEGELKKRPRSDHHHGHPH